jgi:hypothetical protein
MKRGFWDPSEDLKVAELFLSLGRQWYRISQELTTRTENAIKNRLGLIVDKEGRPGESAETTVTRILPRLREAAAQETEARARQAEKD